MGRLIDADDLKYQMFGEGYQTKWTNEQIADAIDNQPTAYDVNDIVADLEEEFVDIVTEGDATAIHHWNSAIEKAVSIVKGAVKG